MLVRLLVAVLTLVGPLPSRACTCAAGHADHSPDAGAAATPPPGEACCRAHHPPTGGAGSTPEANGPALACDAHQSAEHERDCPAANPRPLLREAVSQPATSTPSDDFDAATAVAWAGSPLAIDAPAAFSSERPRAPKNPLYLTLLSLRN